MAEEKSSSQQQDNEDEGSQLPAKPKPTNDLVEGFNSIGLVRQIGLMIGIAASVAIGFALVLWSQEPDYRPLYAGLDRLDSDEVIQILEYNDIPFKVDERSGAMLVKVEDVHRARLKLAEAGLPGEHSKGFELLDQEQPIGTSQFMENARYRRSLEGELGRTITSINAVRSARVHLAIPKRSMFVRDPREPRASVFVELFPGRTLGQEQVKAITNLVASSIPELALENVTVVDHKGSLLSNNDTPESLKYADQQRDYVRKLEAELAGRVTSILAPIVGTGNFNTEVNVDVDFTEVEQANEQFNPDLPALRSEETYSEVTRDPSLAAGIPGALTNQPPGVNADAPEQANAQGDANATDDKGNSRKQAVRNFELDRSVSYTRHPVGRINRLSVAVVLDDKVVPGADGVDTRQAWSDAELARLAVLVRDAIGYSAARGDSVNLVNSAFLPPEDLPPPEDPPIWEQEWFQTLAKNLSMGLGLMVLVFGLFRPILRNLAATGRKEREEEEAREMAELEAHAGDFDAMGDSVTLTGGDAIYLPSPEETYEQQLNAVKGLIADDAGRVAQVVKKWIAEEM